MWTHRVSVALLCLLVVLPAGCLDRKLTITSEPKGALVFVSSEEIGRTPVTIPFTWYGDYEVVLRMQGFQTLKTHWNVTPPLYDVPPFDFFSAVAPWTYRVHKTRHFTLQRREEIDDAELYRRAEELRVRNDEPEK